jgi:hypothetical protein
VLNFSYIRQLVKRLCIMLVCRMCSIASGDTCDYVLMTALRDTVHVPKQNVVQHYHSKAY